MKSSDVSKFKDNTVHVKSETPLPSLPKKKKKWGWVVAIVVVLILGVVGFGVFKGVQIFEKIGLKIDSSSLAVNNKEPELQKDSTGKYTNFLIVGVDKGETNTDTIMIVSYNYDTNSVTMLSIPRDFYVKLPTGNYFKINSAYYYGGEDTAGLDTLVKTVKEVTGIEVQYYSLVNFSGFVDIIDSIHGIDINVDKALTDHYYPAVKGETGSRYDCFNGECGYWKTVSFSEGVQHMDGETALEYARSRHSSSDYDRARRQQDVVLAVKDKVMSTSTLTSPKSIMGIISSVADNIKISSFTIEDIQATLNLLTKFNESGKSYSFLLDPSAGNSSLVVSSDIGSSHQEPKLGLGNYTDIKEYVQLIITQPAIYSENAKIYVYNTGLGVQATYNKVQDMKAQFPYLNIVYKGTLSKTIDGTYVYSHTENEFIQTISDFSSYLQTTNTTKPEAITTNLNNEDVTILLGKEITQLTGEQ